VTQVEHKRSSWHSISNKSELDLCRQTESTLILPQYWG